VVPNAETHQPMSRPITLKLRSDYNLRENAKNKEMQKIYKREMQPAVQKKKSYASPMRMANLDQLK